jgi:hypothetical protein
MWEFEALINYKFTKKDPPLDEIGVTGKIILNLLSAFRRKLLLPS